MHDCIRNSIFTYLINLEYAIELSFKHTFIFVDGLSLLHI